MLNLWLFEQTQLEGRRYIQKNDTQHNDSQHKGLICDTQHKWYSGYKALSLTQLIKMIVTFYLLLC
jgi:hypothetical protein